MRHCFDFVATGSVEVAGPLRRMCRMSERAAGRDAPRITKLLEREVLRALDEGPTEAVSRISV